MPGAEHEFRLLADTGIGSPGLPLYTADELAQSPSIRQGMDPDTERRNRLQYTRFITDLGMQLQVPQWAIYTAVFLCHHYYAKRSFQLSDKYLVAVACLYLACKVQESPKYLRDVIKHAEMQKWGRYCKDHPLEPRKWEDMAHLEQVRDEVLVAERALLYTLSFQLRIQTPYPALLQLQATMPDGHKHNLVNIAWSVINDSLKTPVSLMHPPEQLAAAAVLLAYQCMGLQPPRDKQGRDFYAYTKTPASTATAILELLLSVYNTAVLPRGAAGLQPPGTPPRHQEPDAGAAAGPGEPVIQLRGDRMVVVPQQQAQQQGQQHLRLPQHAQPQQQQQQQQPAGAPAAPKQEQGATPQATNPATPLLQGQQQPEAPPAVKAEAEPSGA